MDEMTEMAAAIRAKVQFLRSVLPLMTETDATTFQQICTRINNGTVTIMDLGMLQELENKFLKEE